MKEHIFFFFFFLEKKSVLDERLMGIDFRSIILILFFTIFWFQTGRRRRRK